MKSYLALTMALGLCVAAAPAMANHHEGDKEDMARAWFSKMDENNDGVVSIREHEKFSEKMFRKTDSNGDNAITYEEFKTFKHKKDTDHWKKVDGRDYNG